MNWAAANGIVLGYTDTVFSPDTPVTREQMTAILHRYAQYKNADVSVGEDTNILSFRDISDLSQWAYPSMQWAVGAGLLQGKGSADTLAPLDNTTRAEVATFFLRMDLEVL